MAKTEVEEVALTKVPVKVEPDVALWSFEYIDPSQKEQRERERTQR